MAAACSLRTPICNSHAGNCYGIIGANGAGKSTLLKILSGDLDSTDGHVDIKPGVRMSVLKQDQFQYDAYSVLDTVIMGNQRLYDIGKQKDALYEKEDFSDEDGILRLGAGGGIRRAGRLGSGDPTPPGCCRALASPWSCTTKQRMGDMDGRDKVKVLLAQALFGNPDIVMLDEPTNNLDIASIELAGRFPAGLPRHGHRGVP